MSRKHFQNILDYSFKILFLGSVGVGKTNIIFSYVNDKINKDQKSTIGIDYRAKTIEYKTKKINLKIFDTSGQERFKALTRNYYQGSDGIIMVFDIKRRETFEDITYWMEEVTKTCDKNKIGLVLVGNKNDGNMDERKISKEEGIKVSDIYDFKYIETSALINDNIKECFDLLLHSILFEILLVNNNKGKVLLNNKCNNNENQYRDYFFICCQ
jgi:small GTP-binding protein